LLASLIFSQFFAAFEGLDSIGPASSVGATPGEDGGLELAALGEDALGEPLEDFGDPDWLPSWSLEVTDWTLAILPRCNFSFSSPLILSAKEYFPLFLFVAFV
jgi:hypothetical protein